MADVLCSVGLDVGTTTTQLIVSQLTVENQASAFSVPRMAITNRKILYKSPIHFTPLLGGERVDGDGIRQIVLKEYEAAGIRREQVDTGAVIITGETSRKENAKAVLASLSDFAGDFVVATAGPDLESVLAAKGSGAVERSENTTVLHMDIGGGTSNLALIQDRKIVQTGCMNVGGRLVKIQDGRISYISPVLDGLTELRVGDRPSQAQITAIAQTLAQALEMVAGLRQPTELLNRLATRETGQPLHPMPAEVISFSGGVADCIENIHPLTAFGDLGPALGQAIRRSRLCQGAYFLGKETIRATVIGAGCHSAQLSGSTVFYRNVTFPLKNLPVVTLGQTRDTDAVVVAMEGIPSASYAQVAQLAEEILEKIPHGAVYLVMEQDMAKALGQALALRMEPSRPLLCLDRLQLGSGDYLDVAAPIGPALPVVIKTLVFSQ
ncbi:MAG: ethanolamine ammonia-lyase [Ruminococcaceae bacterium]|nr:ethanolamine ammonia-lyase [Oscillospiraceae bacterium]MBQ3215689.1 ethanolamine ammonia-lyase reactivating factor EutA [Oscillospiraceae bacterium]